MPDDLYDRDILSWSQRQAALLRRLARGEQVNGVDWGHVAEEIEGVGLSELNAVRSYLRLMLVHLLKVHGWPGSPAVEHWRGEIGSFQADAAQRFAPSMRRKVGLAALYGKALGQLDGITYDGRAPRPWPAACPFTLNDLLKQERAVLEDRLQAASPEVAG